MGVQMWNCKLFSEVIDKAFALFATRQRHGFATSTGASTGGDHDLLLGRFLFTAVRCAVVFVFVDAGLLLFFLGAAAGAGCPAFH